MVEKDLANFGEFQLEIQLEIFWQNLSKKLEFLLISVRNSVRNFLTKISVRNSNFFDKICQKS